MEFSKRLHDALEEIRTCRNNMSRDEFLTAGHGATENAAIAFPLLELSSVVSFHRIVLNAVGDGIKNPTPGKYLVMYRKEDTELTVATLTKNSGWYYDDQRHVKMVPCSPYRIVERVE